MRNCQSRSAVPPPPCCRRHGLTLHSDASLRKLFFVLTVTQRYGAYSQAAAWRRRRCRRHRSSQPSELCRDVSDLQLFVDELGRRAAAARERICHWRGK